MISAAKVVYYFGLCKNFVQTPTKLHKKLVYTKHKSFFYQFIWYFHFFVVILQPISIRGLIWTACNHVKIKTKKRPN